MVNLILAAAYKDGEADFKPTHRVHSCNCSELPNDRHRAEMDEARNDRQSVTGRMRIFR